MHTVMHKIIENIASRPFGPENFDFRFRTAIDMFASLIFITYPLFEFLSNEKKSLVTIEALEKLRRFNSSEVVLRKIVFLKKLFTHTELSFTVVYDTKKDYLLTNTNYEQALATI
jgi:hypothetical protein